MTEMVTIPKKEYERLKALDSDDFKNSFEQSLNEYSKGVFRKLR